MDREKKIYLLNNLKSWSWCDEVDRELIVPDTTIHHGVIIVRGIVRCVVVVRYNLVDDVIIVRGIVRCVGVVVVVVRYIFVDGGGIVVVRCVGVDTDVLRDVVDDGGRDVDDYGGRDAFGDGQPSLAKSERAESGGKTFNKIKAFGDGGRDVFVVLV